MYVGLDVHKRYSQVAVVDDEGCVLEEFRVWNDVQSLQDLAKTYRGSKAVIEATSNWLHIYSQLEECMEVCLAHPTKTRIIAEARVKNDRFDAKMLAHLLRADLVARSYVPGGETREFRGLVRARRSLVQDRNRCKNRVHAALTRNGVGVEKPFTRRGRKRLEEATLPQVDRAVVEANLAVIETLNREIKELEKIIERRAEKNQEVMLLTTIPGISHYSALLIKGEIGDINRFPHAKKLVSYAGLNPSVKQSGDRVVRGRITKEGSKWLRWILVQCANVAVRHDPHLKRFYLRLRRRKGHKIAIVATARKMLVCVYYMLRKEERYKPN